MKFGLGTFTFQQAPWSDDTFHEIYRDGIELVKLGEDVGFDSAWTSEHHFTEDGFLPSPAMGLGAFATATDRIELGTSIALAPFYNPMRLAEDLAVVDQIAGGRLTFGVGLGYREKEFDGYNISRDRRVAQTVELVEVLKRAWTEEEFTFEGKCYEFGPATVSPPPASDPRPRILIGANIPKAIRRAAKYADGYIPSRASEFDEIPEQYRIFREEKVKHDEPVGGYELPMMIYGMVHEDHDTAWELMRDGFAYFHHVHTNFRTTSPDAWFQSDDETQSFADMLTDERERELKERALVGTPEEVREQVAELRELLGPDLHLIVRLRHPGMSFDDSARAVELFADQVIPHFRD